MEFELELIRMIHFVRAKILTGLASKSLGADHSETSTKH